MKIEIDTEYERLADKARHTLEYKKERVISDFTNRISRRMGELRITQSDFARRLNVTRAYVSNILSGKVNFTFETATKISTALDMDFEAVLVHHGGEASNCGRIPLAFIQGATMAKLNSSWRPAIYAPTYPVVKESENEEPSIAAG